MDKRERDVRSAILLLVKAHKMWQVRAVRLDKALNAILALPPTKRAALSVADLDALTRAVSFQIQEVADKLSSQIERKLEGDADFLAALSLYASKQFWDGDET
jgi:hypothetical protein